MKNYPNSLKYFPSEYTIFPTNEIIIKSLNTWKSPAYIWLEIKALIKLAEIWHQIAEC